MNVLWSKRYKHIMIQGVWTFCDWKDVNVFWPKIYKTVVTERLPINDHKRKSVNGSWPKDVKLILTERVETDLDHDQKGANWFWPKGCKWSWPKGCDWIVTERLRLDRDRKVAIGSWPKGANGRDRNIANELWQKSANVSWLVTEECKRVVSKRVPMNHGRRGKNGSWLKKCERDITERMLKINYGASDIWAWPFLDNIKSYSN